MTSFTLADWLPNATLITADCKTAVIGAHCPKLSVPRSIEFTIFYQIGNNQIGLSNVIRRCKNTKSVNATFSLKCKSLYAVNISLSPMLPDSKCSEYCEYTVHTSNMWWLGKECNNEIQNDCIYEKYKTSLNSCPQSSTKCSDLSTTIRPENYKSKYSEWQPNIKLVSAFCRNFTVEATCPHLNESRNMEFYLYKKGEDIIIYTVVKICRAKLSKTWDATFPIDCFNLYFIKVSMGITIDPPICDELCSKHHSSKVWLLGNSLCTDGNVDKCENSHYTTELNKCPTTFDNCVKPNHYFVFIICIIVFFVIILFGIIIYKIPQIKAYCFVKIWYHRANDNVLLTNGSEV